MRRKFRSVPKTLSFGVMCSMSNRPEIKLGGWIAVGSTSCVVADVRDNGDCEVVFNSSKPTNCDARWNGESWAFVESGDYGGYADKYSRLSLYVQILKRGRYA
jgi:hypothetical protein